MKKVICIETEEVFESVAEAARHTGVIATNISAVCKNRRRSAGGFHWEYIEETEEVQSEEEALVLQEFEEFQAVCETIEELETSSTYILDSIKQLGYDINHGKTQLKIALETHNWPLVYIHKQGLNGLLKLQGELIQQYVNTQEAIDELKSNRSW